LLGYFRVINPWDSFKIATQLYYFQVSNLTYILIVYSHLIINRNGKLKIRKIKKV
jgi:hypothetical protein